jgi:phage shock protein PspC (stress-responsive transcriptional regulator)
MSTPQTVKVSRDGKEIGEYSVPEALRLLAEGTLRGTDHYWQQGMTDWALMSVLKAKEEFRIKNEQELKARNEKAQAAEKLLREKAEAEAKSQKEKADAARIQSEQKNANNFQCHCCRDSFPRPYDPTEDFRPATQSFFLNVLWFIIPIFGWILGAIGMWRATIRMLASGLHLPSCPKCRSVNFSRPTHDATFYPLLPIGVAGYCRSSDEGWIGGVCSGVAHFTGISVVLVRVLFCLGSPVLFIVYPVMMAVFPKRPTKGIVIP